MTNVHIVDSSLQGNIPEELCIFQGASPPYCTSGILQL